MLASCDSQKELTAEDVATMKIAEFCTSYKSRLPSKPREKGGVAKAKVLCLYRFQRPGFCSVLAFLKCFQAVALFAGSVGARSFDLN